MWRRCPPVCWREPAPGTFCPSSIPSESSLPGISSWPNPASWNYKIRYLRFWVMIQNVLFNYTFCAHLWDVLLFSQIMSLANYEEEKDLVKSQCRIALCKYDKIFCFHDNITCIFSSGLKWKFLRVLLKDRIMCVRIYVPNMLLWEYCVYLYSLAWFKMKVFAGVAQRQNNLCKY